MNHAHSIRVESVQDRYASRIAARLAGGADELPYDISERLRAARAQAVAQRKLPVRTAAPAVLTNGGNQAVLGGGWWHRLASAVPLLALAAGMVALNVVLDDRRANELAEVDAALLTDDLPPAAYTDPGFLQFLNDARSGAD
jgi:hypothetical protein